MLCVFSGHSLRTKLAAMQVLESVLPTCNSTSDTDFKRQVRFSEIVNASKISVLLKSAIESFGRLSLQLCNDLTDGLF